MERGNSGRRDAEGGTSGTSFAGGCHFAMAVVAVGLSFYLTAHSTLSEPDLIPDAIQGLGGLSSWSIGLITTYGPLMIFVLMAMESSSLPVPSEVVLPFAGFLVVGGSVSFEAALLLATGGAMVGSYVDYYIGRYLGVSELVRRHRHLERGMKLTVRWFERYEYQAVFFGRFVVGARTLVSFPAGAAKMNIWRFGVVTLAGCAIWNAALIYVGFLLADRWTAVVDQFNRSFSPLSVAAFVLVVALLYLRQRRRKGRRVASGQSGE